MEGRNSRTLRRSTPDDEHVFGGRGGAWASMGGAYVTVGGACVSVGGALVSVGEA